MVSFFTLGGFRCVDVFWGLLLCCVSSLSWRTSHRALGSQHPSYLNKHIVKFGNFVGLAKLGKMFGIIY